MDMKIQFKEKKKVVNYNETDVSFKEALLQFLTLYYKARGTQIQIGFDLRKCVDILNEFYASIGEVAVIQRIGA